MFHPRRTLRALLLPLAAGLALTALPAQTAQAAATLTNAGFEADGAGAAVPAGWSEYGDTGASFTESGGHGGSYRLSHWASAAYKVETYQYLSGLTNGPYKLTAWVRSGGGQKSAHIALKNCGGAEQRTALPVSASGWIRVVVPVKVTNNQCTISVNSDANAGNWINVDDLTFTSGTSGLAIKGADISSLAKSEAKGGVYRTASGTVADPVAVLKNAGMNYARLKVWVNPADGYNDKARVLATAKRVKAAGQKLLVDFHYSDIWADPGAQSKPAAWAGHSYSRLRTDVYRHTYDVLNALKAQGTTADMVQVGNEINGGMLWSEGSTDNWGQLAGLLNSGYDAAKAVNSSTPVALHLAKGGDLAGTRWWFDNAVANGVRFDAIGLSYYGYWHGTLADFQTTLDDAAARYGKPVFVAETAYPFRLDSKDSHENIIDLPGELVSGYPATAAGQLAWMNSVADIVEAVPGGRGLGVFYWEATWTAVDGNGWDPADAASGNGWENQALFGYDDRALSSMAWFGHRCPAIIRPRDGGGPPAVRRPDPRPPPSHASSPGRGVPSRPRPAECGTRRPRPRNRGTARYEGPDPKDGGEDRAEDSRERTASARPGTAEGPGTALPAATPQCRNDAPTSSRTASRRTPSRPNRACTAGGGGHPSPPPRRPGPAARRTDPAPHLLPARRDAHRRGGPQVRQGPVGGPRGDRERHRERHREAVGVERSGATLLTSRDHPASRGDRGSRQETYDMTAPETESLRSGAGRRPAGTAQLPAVAVVAVGGGLGAAARYAASLWWPSAAGGFPWTTFWVNVVGCAVIGVFLVLITEALTVHRLVRPFFATGVLGGFTTFSTYAVDLQRLFDTGHPRTALAYLAATPLAALTAVWLAATATRRALTRRQR